MNDTPADREPMLLISFTRERETKRTWRYAEQTKAPDGKEMVGVLYVKKDALEHLGTPEELSVTIKAG